jgi:hypothetical protein
MITQIYSTGICSTVNWKDVEGIVEWEKLVGRGKL